MTEVINYTLLLACVLAMVLFKSNVQILLVVFVNMVSAEMDSRENKGHVKKTFASLLKNIVDVNEKRVAAINKLSRLQDFIMTKNSLAKVHGIDIGKNSSEDFRDQNAILTLIDMSSNLNLKLRRTYNNKHGAANNNINIIIPFNSFNVQAKHRTDGNYRVSKINNNDKGHDYGKMYKKNDDNDKISINDDEIYKVIYAIGFKPKKIVIKHDEANNENDNEIEMHNQEDDYDQMRNENDDDKMNNENEDYDHRIVNVNNLSHNNIVDSNAINRRKMEK